MLALFAAPPAFTPAACAYDAESPGCKRMRRWFSPRCAAHFQLSSDAPPCDEARQWHCGSRHQYSDPLRLQTRRTAVPLAPALEDFCEYAHGGGVGRIGVHPTHVATESSVLSSHRMVFIDNKKAGSTFVTQLIEKHLLNNSKNAMKQKVGSKGSTSCDGAANDERSSYCGQYSFKACSTLCLSPPTLESHVLFAFVRDPVDRFWSALSTAVRALGIPTQGA